MPSTAPPPIAGVLFDFHSTLVDQGDGTAWLDLAWARLRRAGTPSASLGQDTAARLSALLHRVWEGARLIDPHNRRDLDTASHRAVFGELITTHFAGLEPELVDSLYATLTEPWVAYEDAIPTLTALRDKGIRIALVSNIGTGIQSVLDRCGLTDMLDAVVLSYQVGAVKPGPDIFEHALRAIDVPAEQALMVGDSWQDDGGAAALGCRVLILPRTTGPVHGLHQVLALTPW
ncbi:MAG: HAD-IA family hydrolase [Kineosporiaceae bacterium]|nr:HAD-IA family hydrolase [Kineosporiaceae bacterium]